MKAIWKFPLDLEGLQTVSIPKGGKILYLNVQGDVPCLWIEVDPEAFKVDRQFVTYGTGHSFNESYVTEYVGSYIMHHGMFVFHVYELVGVPVEA